MMCAETRASIYFFKMLKKPGSYGDYTFQMDIMHSQEIMERLVDKKWKATSSNISDLRVWKDKTDYKIKAFEKEVKNMGKILKNVKYDILDQVDKTERKTKDIASSLKAMGMVMNKLIPHLEKRVKEAKKIKKMFKS